MTPRREVHEEEALLALQLYNCTSSPSPTAVEGSGAASSRRGSQPGLRHADIARCLRSTMGGASSAPRAAKREDDFPADKATAITAGVSPMVPPSKDGGKDASLTPNVAALHRMPSLTGSIRRRIALFGGSFDPITNVHLDCAAAVIQHRTCDEVWLVPCGPRPDKPSLKTPSADRVSMARLAVGEYFPSHWPISVCDAEANLPEALPTIELLELLQEAQKPEVDFYFAIGTDLVKQVPEWPPDGPRLARDFNFLIIPRAGEAFNPSSIPLHWKCLETVKGTSINQWSSQTCPAQNCGDGWQYAMAKQSFPAGRGVASILSME